MTLAGIEALGFAVFGTVVDWRGGVAREAEAVLGRHGIRLDGFAFADSWRARCRPAMEAVRLRKRPFVPLDVLHRETLEAVLAEFGIAGLPEPALDELNLAWHRLDPWPDVLPGLARLERRYILATFSNGNVRLLVNMAWRAGLPWDAILGAEPTRAYKPSPDAYLGSVAVLGTTPERVLMVAAHDDDLAAARSVRLRTALVPRPREHGSGRTRAPVPEQDWDIVATDFEDLAAKLGC